MNKNIFSSHQFTQQLLKKESKLRWKTSFGIEHEIPVNFGHEKQQLQTSKMSDFELWFAYYDSLFTNSYPKFTNQFYQNHYITEADWPFHISHYLSSAYQALQKFITHPNNWVSCQCSTQQLETVQEQIDELLHLINIQKSYAFVFWGRDPRRIEASVLHLYTYLQMLIKALIPYSSMTVFECKSANKLCVNFFSLERLMKEILACVNPLAKFLSGNKFKEEENIIANFFQNLVAFMKKLPRIKKNKLQHIHNLAKFITLTNPIEICAKKQVQTGIRKKSNTLGYRANLQLNQNPQELQLNAQKSFKKVKPIIKRCSSCLLFYSPKTGQISQNISSQKKQVLFKFPENVMKNSLQVKNKVKESNFPFPPIIPTRKKTESITKDRTMTTDQTNKLSPPKINSPRRQKAKSTFQRMHKLSLNKRTSVGFEREKLKRRETKFYYDQYERDEQRLSLKSSKEGSTRNRQLSVISNYVNFKSEVKLKSQKELSLFGENRLNFCISEGIIRKSKWDLVKLYLNEKIKSRKIQKIMKAEI